MRIGCFSGFCERLSDSGFTTGFQIVGLFMLLVIHPNYSLVDARQHTNTGYVVWFCVIAHEFLALVVFSTGLKPSYSSLDAMI